MSSPSRLVRGNSFVRVELYFNFSLFEPHAWRVIIIINCTYIGQHRDRVVSRRSRSSPQCRHIVLLLFCVFLSNKDFYCSSVSEQYTNSNLCSERLFGQNTSHFLAQSAGSSEDHQEEAWRTLDASKRQVSCQ